MSQLPNNWTDILSGPCYVINLEEQAARWETAESRISAAGFQQVYQYQAVNGHNDVSEEWAQHNVNFDVRIFEPHAAGCMLSHLNVWRHIIDNRLAYAVIFEDDVLFHKHWERLAPSYYAATPKSAHMVFMGHHCGNMSPDVHIARFPAYCLNAYILTYDGAVMLYDKMTKNYPFERTFAIDMMIVELQSSILRGSGLCDYEWYAWNSEMYPDEWALEKIHPNCRHKDKGLVFQEWMPKLHEETM